MKKAETSQQTFFFLNAKRTIEVQYLSECDDVSSVRGLAGN